MSAFDSWYNGMVGFHINSERMLDDFKHDIGGGYGVDPIKLRKWMAVCWNNALDAAKSQLVHDDYYYDSGPSWDGDDYFSCDPRKDIEDLKEKI